MIQKVIKSITNYLQTCKYRRQAKTIAAIRKESQRVVQIREFNSQLYISYHDNHSLTCAICKTRSACWQTPAEQEKTTSAVM